MSPLAGPPRTCVRGATLKRRDWIGTGEGLGSAAALVAGSRVGRSLCLCLRPHPFPPDEVYTRGGCGVVYYVNRCSLLRTAFACIYAHYFTFVRILAHSLRAAF